MLGGIDKAVAAKLWPPKYAYRSLLNSNLLKKVLDVMLHFEFEWPLNNILIADTSLAQPGP